MKKRIRRVAAVAFSAVLGLPAIVLAQAGGYNPPDCELVGLPCGKVEDIVSNFAMWLLGIFGTIGVIAFVIAGIMYLTAAGDETKVERAKKMLLYGVVGIIVGLLGLIIQKTIFFLLQG